jgi:K+-sensing histidine kinase KdpD
MRQFEKSQPRSPQKSFAGNEFPAGTLDADLNRMASVISLPSSRPSPLRIANDYVDRRALPTRTPAESPKTTIIACVDPHSSCNADLLRKAQLAARENGGEFYAALLESPRSRFGKVMASALDDVILASYFGAKIVWLKSPDAVGELMQLARKTQAGRVFVSRSQPRPFLRSFGRSVYSELLNRGEGFRIDVVGFGAN